MPPCPHFDLKIVQRSKRQSAVAAAAYQSGERLFSEYDQKQKYYSHKSEIVHTEIMLPPHAPPEYAEKHLKTKADYRRSEIASKKMLSNISHDIKTPMTVILGYLEIMQLSETPSKEMLKKVERKAQSVMELINQFFTLSKIESGDMEIELSRIDICEICRESILDFYELLSNKNFQVEVDIPEKSVYTQGNKEALQRILFNLISNVIRYGADGKYLGISLRNDERNVYVDVTDKGKGIDKAFADSIFDRLFTMEDSRNRNIQGNGLGLTIAKNLALRLGGTITVESVPHVKTTFTVRLKKISF